MKNYFLLFSMIFLAEWLSAQAPTKFNYQAVARDQGGQVITGNVGVRISFLQGSENGSTQYVEEHQVTTNAQGVFHLIIGDGSVSSGNINNLYFDQHSYWLKIDLKAGGDDYKEMGKTPLLSVPYASYAAKAGNDLQAGSGIQINNNVITNTGDMSDVNELQQLSLNGNQLHLSDANTVTLPTGTTYTEGPGIEINGNELSAEDVSATNELQNLSLNGSQLSISNGNYVTLPVYTAGAGIQITGNQIIATDASISNEIQNLSINGNQLFLSNGGGNVQIPHQWVVNNGSEITNTPSSNSVVIGSTSDFGSKLYVSASGNDHAGNFYSPGSGNALHAYCNGTGYALSASSLNGTGAIITSNSGTAAVFDGGAAPTIQVHQNNSQNGIELIYNGNAWGFQQHPLGSFYFDYNGNHKAWISHGDGAYHQYSDRSLKKDIQPVSNVVDKLSQLQAYTYHMKTASDDAPISLGLMAQDVAQQFPELVTEMDGYQSICYDHFAVLAVQAVKEQQVQINHQQEEIDLLKAEMAAMKELIEKMRMVNND